MEDMLSEIEKQAEIMIDNYRKEIRNSKYGLLKLVGIELVPVAWGATLGGIGRVTGEPMLPAAPIVFDLMVNATGYTTGRGMWNLIKYGIGVALPYADMIYLALE